MIDVRVVMSSWRELTWLLGAGGQLWGGGPEPHIMKEFGPDLGVFFRQWQTSLDFQAGYGNNHGYGAIAVSRHFGWDEQEPRTGSTPFGRASQTKVVRGGGVSFREAFLTADRFLPAHLSI
jgi:hypothetical protein